MHLSQAGRLDIEEPPKKTKPRGSVARFVFGPGDAGLDTEGIGILVREHGTQRKASWWVLAPGDEGPLAGLGTRAGERGVRRLRPHQRLNRHLTTDLRDQHVVSGIGRGWGDDILHRAKLSPFASLRSLSPAQREDLLAAVSDVLADALELERARAGRALGGQARRPLQRCTTASASPARRRAAATRCAGVSFESYEMTYCPTCQTGGKVLADRRLSRLLK